MDSDKDREIIQQIPSQAKQALVGELDFLPAKSEEFNKKIKTRS